MTDLDDYIEQHSSLSEGVMYELYRHTHLTTVNPHMMSSRVQGKFLEMLCRMIRPENALEIGAFTGYSTMSIATGLPEKSKLYSIEVSDENESTIRHYLAKGNLADKVELLIGDAKQIIPQLDIRFDFVFIDADKRNNQLYYDLIFDKVSDNGYMLIDNTLWSGKVVNPSAGDIDTRCIKEFNDRIQSDDRVENIILPLRDGLTIVRKK